jgi:hypothetical protein
VSGQILRNLGADSHLDFPMMMPSQFAERAGGATMINVSN